MRTDARRVTLVARSLSTPDRDWDDSSAAVTRTIFVDSFAVLKYAIRAGIVDMEIDIERVVVDRAASPSDFLDLLAALPHEFSGDVILVNENDAAFLSATGRGGDRVLYALSPTDVRFYLEAHGLVTGRLAMEQRMTA
ncbi:MAG TPA: hypothetical protein VGF69_12155 [Thermoanaerobaculia bacterium]|jgi:hypothetical protein